jgi:hypothetical protein
MHVGLHKTATTWLQERYFPFIGGMANDHHKPWQDPLIRSLVTGEGTPPPLDSHSIVSAERLSGHPATGWMDADTIAARIARAYPTARLVVGTREPSSWARSLYHQVLREGEIRPLHTLLEPRWRGTYFNFAQVSPEALRARYEQFPAMLLLPIEQLMTDPHEYVARLSDFIGVATPQGLDFSPHHQDSMRRPELYRRANRFIRSDLNPAPAIRAGRIARIVQRALA